MNKKLVVISFTLTVILIIAIGVYFLIIKKSLDFNLGEIRTENSSFYKEIGKENFNREDYDMSTSEVDKLYRNIADYRIATIPITIKNNLICGIYIVGRKVMNNLPEGIWLYEVYSEDYPYIEKGNVNSGQIRFLYNKNDIKEDEIKKIIISGEVGIKFGFKYSKCEISIPINKDTAFFPF